jgi:hypothetical protein
MVSFWISGLFSGSAFSCSSETLQYLTITKKKPKRRLPTAQQLLQKMKNSYQEYKILNAELEGFISHEL